MLGQMDERLRRCLRLQNAAVPVVARMRLAGAPFVRALHLETIERWERELAEKRAAFIELTGEEPPARHKVGAWIEAHLPADETAWMPRTATGALSARSDLLKYLAHHEEIRPLPACSGRASGSRTSASRYSSWSIQPPAGSTPIT
jgi:hypothetical protein